VANDFGTHVRKTGLFDRSNQAPTLEDDDRVSVALCGPPAESSPSGVNRLFFGSVSGPDRYLLFEKAAKFLVLAISDLRGRENLHLPFPRIDNRIGRFRAAATQDHD